MGIKGTILTVGETVATLTKKFEIIGKGTLIGVELYQGSSTIRMNLIVDGVRTYFPSISSQQNRMSIQLNLGFNSSLIVESDSNTVNVIYSLD